MQRRDASAYAAGLVGTFLLVLFVALVLTIYSRSGIGSALRPVDKLGAPRA